MFFPSLLMLCVTLLIRYNLQYRRMHKYVAHMPSLKRYPLIVAYKLLFKNNKGIFNTLLEIILTMQNSTTAWFGTQLFIVVNKVEDVQSVLLSPNCLDKPFLYRFFPFKGIFTSEVHIWKPSRKLYNPSFNMKILLSYIPIFNKKSKLMVDQLKLKMHEKDFKLSKYIFSCTLDITCGTFMGFESETLLDKNEKFSEGMERMFQIVTNRILKFWLHPSFFYKLTRSYETEKDLFDEVLRVTNMVKAQKLNTFLKRKDEVNHLSEETSEISPEISPVMDQLFKLEAEGKITNDEITNHLATMLFTGNETSALMISQTIIMLAMHPKYQDIVFDELKTVCHSSDETITYEMISNLQYLEMVIKESMRLFPIGPILGRHCTADTKISTGTIPKGTIIGVVVYNLHRDPKIWGPDSNNFNPDHFSHDQMAGKHPYCYLPFSAGPRNCFGMKYAWMSMKVVLAHLLLNFKFSTDIKMSKLRIRFHGVMKVDNLHNIKVERRDY